MELSPFLNIHRSPRHILEVEISPYKYFSSCDLQPVHKDHSVTHCSTSSIMEPVVYICYKYKVVTYIIEMN